MLPFFVGVVVGASIAALLVILIGPSRRVRAEPPIPRDVETKILLGEDPDQTPPAEPVEEDHGSYSPKDLEELRRLGTERSRRKR